MALLSRNEKKSSLQDCSGQDTMASSEFQQQDVEECLPDEAHHSSEFANRTAKGSEVHPLETSDIDEIAEKVRTLQVRQESLDACTDATKHEAKGVEKQSLLDLYYGASPKKNEQKRTNALDSVVELYDFPPTFKTHDLLNELKPYSPKPYRLKWVNDTRALVIFPSSTEANTVAKAPITKFKVRLIRMSDHPFSVTMAENVAESMQASLAMPHQPVSKQRPKTNASVARRMVSHALGVRVQVSPKQKEIEENDLREAKAQKRKRHVNKEQSSGTSD